MSARNLYECQTKVTQCTSSCDLIDPVVSLSQRDFTNFRYDELKQFENLYERAKHYLKEYHHESGRTFSQPQIQPK